MDDQRIDFEESIKHVYVAQIIPSHIIVMLMVLFNIIVNNYFEARPSCLKYGF